MKTLVVKYSCVQCGIVKAEVSVPCRLSKDDDLGTWMKDLGVFLREDHDARSPACTANTAQDVMIPVPAGAEWVGA